jgi:hypothetical protein
VTNRRTTSLAACFVAGLLLGAVFTTAAPADPAAARPKPPEPEWNRVNQFGGDNRFYLTRLSWLRWELGRFRDDRRGGDLLVQLVATEYSYVGRYREALEAFDDRPDGPDQKEDPPALDGYEPRDAVAALLELADRHRVILLNEAHHVPMHRAFTLRLLQGLYRKGFRYFAAETLTARDDALQARGYPTLKTGAYLPEPVYADLVRTALRLGYKVVPYEFEAATSPWQSNDPVAAQNAREEGQARNLKDRILAKDPGARIVVHAGYGHISKKAETFELNGKKGRVRFMAGAFQALTGIVPLSVDQTLMSEHSRPRKEAADYRTAVARGLVTDRPVVFRGKKGAGYYVPASVRENYDLVVFHPRSRYENGRPTWLALGGRRRAHAVRTEGRPPPGSSYLAQAFAAGEKGRDAVPVDQIEFGPDEPAPTLWLPAGECRIRVVDEGGKVLHEYVTKG